MLKISDDLSLPLEAVTQTFAILAKRGSGKTYTGLVMVEEMLKKNLHVVYIDPIGVAYGLRSSADGESAGLPIIIAGGDHADIPIEPTNGEVLANLVVDNTISVVIDLSRMRKGEQVRFMTDFAETLYHRNRSALHLVLDEADAFAPQRPMPGEHRLLGAMEDIVRRGRARGIGVTMITQRPSVLNKNVLTQIEVLVTLRLTAPIDQKAIDEWVKTHAEEGQREQLMASLPSLPVGTAWFWSPGWLNIFQRIKVRERETLDSSLTPKVGEKIKQAKVLADVDLQAIREQLAETIEKVESDDPTALKRRIADLERKLHSQAPVVQAKVETRVETKEVPALSPQQVKVLRSHIPPVVRILQDLFDVANSTFQPVNTSKTEPIRHSNAPKEPVLVHSNASSLKKGAVRMLRVLGDGYPLRFTKAQMASLAKMKVTGGTFSVYYGQLKREGYFVEDAGGLVITEKGLRFLGIERPIPSTASELRSMWRRVLRAGECRIFDRLADAYPRPVDRNNLAYSLGFEPSGGTYGAYIGNLRRNGIAVVEKDRIKLADELGGGHD